MNDQGEGEGECDGGRGDDGVDAPPTHNPTPPTSLNTAVHRRRADRAFYLRLAEAMQVNERALERLR
jgi:hypothetical protein